MIAPWGTIYNKGKNIYLGSGNRVTENIVVISKGKYINQLCVYSLNIVDKLRDESLTVGGLIDHMRFFLFSGEDAVYLSYLLFDKAKPEPHCTKTPIKKALESH